MKLEEIKDHLSALKTISFKLPTGELVPAHFHVTEVGKITKDFIDCGGNVRHQEVVNFQLWNAQDYNHRLHPEKLVHIINLSQEKLEIGNLDIEVEYQADTIGKYGLDFDGEHFLLTTKNTDCLALSECGIPDLKAALKTVSSESCCSSEAGCC